VELLVCSGCGARVAGPADACPLCRGAVRPSVAATWTGAISADGLWSWDGASWQPAAAGQGRCRYCNAALQSAWVACPHCGAPVAAAAPQPSPTFRPPSPAGAWVTREERIIVSKDQLNGALPPGVDFDGLRAALERDAGRLLSVRCPGCGQQDFEATAVNNGPLQVRCRRCGAAVPI
jgi:ribosomal protein S27E